jgi:hypothetical protein
MTLLRIPYTAPKTVGDAPDCCSQFTQNWSDPVELCQWGVHPIDKVAADARNLRGLDKCHGQVVGEAR